MKKGFTLVELSIVLVIIGLLIGGILAAQSMISTAKIQGVVRQLQQYQIAVTNFQTRYNQLPGDSNLLNPYGNNNGTLPDTNGTFSDSAYEQSYFWSDLSLGVGLKNSKGAVFQNFLWHDATVMSEQYMPQFNLKQNAGPNILLAIYDDVLVPENKNIWLYYTPKNGVTGHQAIDNPLSAADALAIDTKIDDGVETTGKIKGYSFGTGTNCANGTAYNIAGAGYICSLIIDIDPNQ